MSDTDKTSGVFAAIDWENPKGRRDWEIFLTVCEKGVRPAAKIHNIHRMTVYRAKRRVLFALKTAKKPVYLTISRREKV